MNRQAPATVKEGSVPVTELSAFGAGTALQAEGTPPAGQLYAAPAESHFPVAVIAAHGLLAGVTLLLVVLTTLGVGGS